MLDITIHVMTVVRGMLTRKAREIMKWAKCERGGLGEFGALLFSDRSSGDMRVPKFVQLSFCFGRLLGCSEPKSQNALTSHMSC
jgi:hypothetical protein